MVPTPTLITSIKLELDSFISSLITIFFLLSLSTVFGVDCYAVHLICVIRK